jgi:solute carrier family 25 (adenine nucleotide translocator) protein 4/5/6/31
MVLMNDSIREVLAGAAAGTTTKTILAPLDRLKLIVQLQGSIHIQRQGATSSYQNARQAFSKIIGDEGILALWRGNTPTILMQGGTSALNFLFMDLYKKAATRIVGSNDDQNHNHRYNYRLAKSFLAGALAGGTAITCLYPIGLIRTKLALDMGTNTRRLYPNGMRDVATHSYRVNGLAAGLYPGYTVALLSVSLYRMVYLGGYDFCKTELCLKHGLQPSIDANASRLPFGERFLAALGVSMLASTVHYPLDSVRRRLMMQSDALDIEKRYRNGWHCFVQIYKQEGCRGYFLGLGTNYVRSVGAALVLVSYDFFKSLLL